MDFTMQRGTKADDDDDDVVRGKKGSTDRIENRTESFELFLHAILLGHQLEESFRWIFLITRRRSLGDDDAGGGRGARDGRRVDILHDWLGFSRSTGFFWGGAGGGGGCSRTKSGRVSIVMTIGRGM